MTNQIPTIGRIVIYNTSEDDQYALRQLGNNSCEQLPATIVSVHSENLVNLKVMVDGNHPDLWRTSVSHAEEPGDEHSWEWPQRV